MALQTRIAPPHGVRKPIGGGETAPMSLSTAHAPSPPIASPPPRALTAAAAPPVQASTSPAKTLTPLQQLTQRLEGLSMAQISRACTRYSQGDDVDSIMREQGLTADQLDALTKRYPGLPAARNAALAKLPASTARGPRTATEPAPDVPRAAAVAAPNPTPPKKPKVEPTKAEREVAESLLATLHPELVANGLEMLAQGQEVEAVRKALVLSTPQMQALVIRFETLQAEAQALELLAQQVRDHAGQGWDSASIAEKFGMSVEEVDGLVDGDTSVLDEGHSEAAIEEVIAASEGSAEGAYTQEMTEEFSEAQAAVQAEIDAQATSGETVGAETPTETVVEQTEQPAREPRRLVKADRAEIGRRAAAGETAEQIALALNLREDAVFRTMRELAAEPPPAGDAAPATKPTRAARAAADLRSRGVEVSEETVRAAESHPQVQPDQLAMAAQQAAEETAQAQAQAEAEPSSEPQEPGTPPIAAAMQHQKLAATPKQIGAVFTTLGVFVEREDIDPALAMRAFVQIARLERETGLSAQDIVMLLSWGGFTP